MKKLMTILVLIGIVIAGIRFPHIMANGNGGNGFADVPPELPVLP